MARPDKSSPESVKKWKKNLFRAMKTGADLDTCCKYAKISYPLLRKVILMAEKDDEEGKENGYTDFLEEYNFVFSEPTISWLEVIDKAAVKNWTAAAWKLERCRGKQYAARRADLCDVVISNDQGNNVSSEDRIINIATELKRKRQELSSAGDGE